MTEHKKDLVTSFVLGMALGIGAVIVVILTYKQYT